MVDASTEPPSKLIVSADTFRLSLIARGLRLTVSRVSVGGGSVTLATVTPGSVSFAATAAVKVSTLPDTLSMVKTLLSDKLPETAIVSPDWKPAQPCVSVIVSPLKATSPTTVGAEPPMFTLPMPGMFARPKFSVSPLLPRYKLKVDIDGPPVLLTLLIVNVDVTPLLREKFEL